MKVPVIVVGCKLDLRDEPESMSIDQFMTPIMQQFREIEASLECSAASLIQVFQILGLCLLLHDLLLSGMT